MKTRRILAPELAALAAAGLMAAAAAAAFTYSDEALATMRAALNLSALGVLGFNAAERVLTFDHPLWVLVEAGAITLFRSYARAIEVAACVGAAEAAWLTAREAGPRRAVPLALLLLGLPAFAAGLANGGEAPLVILLLSALAAEVGRARRAGPPARLGRLALWTALLFLARFSAATLVLPLLLREAGAARAARDFRRALAGLLPAAAWLAGALLYFGGLAPHSLHGDLAAAGWPAAFRTDGVATLQFADRQPLAGALLLLAVLRVLPAFRPGRDRDFSDWLGLGLALGLAQSFLAGFAGWSPLPVAILLWLAALVLAYDRRLTAGFLVLLLGTLVLAFGGFGALHWPGPPTGVAMAPAWPARAAWAAGRRQPEIPRRLVLDASPGRAGLADGPAAYVLDGFALGDPFWSSLNRQAGATIAGARMAPAGRPGAEPPVLPRASFRDAVTLELRLRDRPPGTLEPLVAAGNAADGDLYAIRYLEHRRIYFSVSKYESAATLLSRTIGPVDFDRVHQLTIKYGREASSGGPAENLIIWDGRLLKDIAAPYRIRRFAPQEIALGWNSVANPDCTSWFSGDILRAGPAEPAALTGFARDEIPVRNRSVLLRIKPAADEPSGQPLLVTGRENAGDAFSLWRVDPGHVRIGHDYWGARAIEWGPVLPFDFSQAHAVDILVLDRGYGGRLATPLVVIRVDRQVAFVLWRALTPFRSDEVYLLENPLQMSSCGQNFEGEILGATSRPPPPEDVGGLTGDWDYLRHRWGGLDLTAMIDGTATAGVGQALVETGRTGRGDILYIVRDDSTHIHFGFDHWGISGFTGPSVAINPRLPHHLSIAMPSLLAPADRTGAAARTVRVTLDGSVVFRADTPCHEAGRDELFLAANHLGASTTGAAFSGLILTADRF
jgi:hypothetical protein